MFIRFAELLNVPDAQPNAEGVYRQADWQRRVDMVFRYRPLDLLYFLEGLWAREMPPEARYYGYPDDARRRFLSEPARIGQPPATAVDGRPPAARGGAVDIPADPYPDAGREAYWKHLIYAYATENTRIVEIMRRVLSEILHGERLGRPNADVLSWARITEELFFTDRLGHWILSPVSSLRSDPGAIRRNAYFRMFGMDLNHGTDDGRPYSYVKPEMANREFARTFERLLMEVWRGYTNRRNRIGPNNTDDAAVADLAHRLHDMLRDRRVGGTLAREEFYAVATLSWFDLTVSADSAVVTMLNAQGTNRAERLRATAERVGLPAHSRSYNYFEMANPLSEILCRIEGGDFNTLERARQLYDGTDQPVAPARHDAADLMVQIIDHWSAATGRNLKEFVGEVPRVGVAALPSTSRTGPLSYGGALVMAREQGNGRP